MISKMLLRGTQNVSKGQIAEEVESMGAHISADSGREMTHLNVTCFKNDVSRAVNMLGDAISNASFDAAELEIAKQEMAQAHEVSNRDQQEVLLEAAHFNSFRDHMLGQPKRGDPDNLQNISVDMLNSFRADNFTGENMVVVGTGSVDHDALVDMVKEGFGSVQQTSSSAGADEKCVYVPALLMMRDDEMYNANVGVFFDAPSVNHEDYYQFQLMRHMIGNYSIERNAEHLNDVSKQYNATHQLLGELPDVTKQSSHYFAYSDCGLWGSYLFGNEVFVRQMNWCGVAAPTFYGDFVTEVEVVRARNAYWNSLMKAQSPAQANAEIGQQMLQVGRRVTRSEIAKRISHADSESIKGLAYEWFYDSEPGFTNWGPIQETSSIGSYKYFKINTMTTVANFHQSLFT